jgi:hypothetical protein
MVSQMVALLMTSRAASLSWTPKAGIGVSASPTRDAGGVTVREHLSQALKA